MLDQVVTWVTQHADVVGTVLGTSVSSGAGVWAVLSRFRKLLREEVSTYAASKEDVARVEGKLDVVIDVIKSEVLSHHVAPAQPTSSSPAP